MDLPLILTNYRAELEKTAATAALKAIRALVNAGKIGKAEALATNLISKGALKTSKQGSQLRFLGSGSEGPAHLVIGAKDAPSKVLVRKMLDPRGAIFSKEQAATKFNTLRRLRANPAADGGHKLSKGSDSFAKLVSNKLHKTPTGGRYYHSEYVPGKDLYQTAMQARGLPKATKAGLPGLHDASVLAGKSHLGKRPGSTIKDALKGRASRTNRALEQSNATNIMVTPSGKPKIVDFYVSPKDSFHAQSAVRASTSTRTVKGGGKAPSPALVKKPSPGILARHRAAAWRDRVPGANTTVADVPAAGGLRSADTVNTLRGLGPGSPRAGATTKGRWTGKQPQGSGPPRSAEYEKMMLDEVGSRNQRMLRAMHNRVATGATNPASPKALSGVAFPPINPFGATVPKGLPFAKTQPARTPLRSR